MSYYMGVGCCGLGSRPSSVGFGVIPQSNADCISNKSASYQLCKQIDPAKTAERSACFAKADAELKACLAKYPAQAHSKTETALAVAGITVGLWALTSMLS